jgi:signal transduction histidine kinase
LADIGRLARSVGGWPRVDVQEAGDFAELSPGLGVALYRIAQEAVTNAVRHARDATRVTVRVADEDEQVRLTVRDDGDASPTGHTPAGYGLVGMAERASLLGGSLQAGPDPDGGWTVDALLPKGVATP